MTGKVGSQLQPLLERLLSTEIQEKVSDGPWSCFGRASGHRQGFALVSLDIPVSELKDISSVRVSVGGLNPGSTLTDGSTSPKSSRRRHLFQTHEAPKHKGRRSDEERFFGGALFRSLRSYWNSENRQRAGLY